GAQQMEAVSMIHAGRKRETAAREQPGGRAFIAPAGLQPPFAERAVELVEKQDRVARMVREQQVQRAVGVRVDGRNGETPGARHLCLWIAVEQARLHAGFSKPSVTKISIQRGRRADETRGRAI